MLNQNYKVWFTLSEDMKAWILDGFSQHPYQLASDAEISYMAEELEVNEDFELGDAWYENVTYGGKAYLVVYSSATGSYGVFSYGQKGILPKWMLYALIIVAVSISLVCLFICFCYVRSMNNLSQRDKVKKFKRKDDSTDDKLSKYKYKADKIGGGGGGGDMSSSPLQGGDSAARGQPRAFDPLAARNA